MFINPYLLISGEQVYQQWRKARLALYPENIDQLVVRIQGNKVSVDERQKIVEYCSKANFAIYHLKDPTLGDKTFVRDFGKQLGLNRLDNNLCADDDSITSLQVMNVGRQAGYIPYTDRPLSWHTDGYYNAPDEQIRGIVMHCAQPAAQGGENLFMDHEMAYIQLRDENPQYIKALMRDTAMTIPANIEQGQQIRAEQTGPVFSVDASGHLHMRYSARTRNIEWVDDEITREAVECLNSLLKLNNPYVFSYSLQAGEGIICNNILHCRSGFNDDAEHKRLLYRARYFDRVSRP